MAKGKTKRTLKRALGSALALLAFQVGVGSCGAKTGLPWGNECTTLDALATLAPLDVVVMLDSSGSMEDPAATGVRKADAMRQALDSFFSDPRSEGIGVALAFFPIIRREVPNFCLGDLACGDPDACQMLDRVCLPSGEDFCETDADCGLRGDECRPLGVCADDGSTLCLRDEAASTYCNPGASCEQVGVCTNQSSCIVAKYADPVVPMATLPSARSALVAALEQRTPEGGTPTLPALDGAIQTARDWSDAHTNRKTIVILATDGFATACDPDVDIYSEDPTQGIPRLIAAAERGVAMGVQTFVVGVFAPEDELDARANLGRIAVAGGTDSAFIITTNQDIAAPLADTLTEIRRAAKTCEYAIPWPPHSRHDPSTLVVRLPTPSGEVVEPRAVASAADCPNDAPAYYFDRLPTPSELPRRVVLCPATCELLGGRSDLAIEVSASCEDAGSGDGA